MISNENVDVDEKKFLELIEIHLKNKSAKLRNYKFVGNTYHTYYNIYCEKNHKVVVQVKNIYKENWSCGSCRRIYRKKNPIIPKKGECKHGKKSNSCNSCIQFKYTINDMKKFAESKNGKCLSDKYLGNMIHLIWQCENNHDPWKATPNNIVNKNSWCPECNSSVNELRCRFILETLLEYQLTKCRPDFLKMNHDGAKPLEYDGYNAEHKIAFEYQGWFHSGTNRINPSEKLAYQKLKDAFKVKKSAELGILLLVIDKEHVKYKSHAEVINYLIKLLIDNNLILKKNNIEKINNLNLDKVLIKNNKMKLYKKEIINLLDKHNGKLLDSDIIISNIRKTKFSVECEFGHSWITNQETFRGRYYQLCLFCNKKFYTDIVRKYDKINKNKEPFMISPFDNYGNCLVKCNKCKYEIEKINIKNIPNKCCKCDATSLFNIYDINLYEFINADKCDNKSNNKSDNESNNEFDSTSDPKYFVYSDSGSESSGSEDSGSEDLGSEDFDSEDSSDKSSNFNSNSTKH